MKVTLLIFALISLFMVAVQLPALTQESVPQERDILFQVSTLHALSNGDFDGSFSFATVKDRGDFGLGTFDALDGEMIALDGEFFQIKADGIAYAVSDETRTPFAAVTFFEADEVFAVTAPASCSALQEMLLSRFSGEEQMVAIKVSGDFSLLQTRSVNPQQKPYVALSEALEKQIVFDITDVEAVMTGFWLPEYLGQLNVAGFHFHALTADQNNGGHVLDCEIRAAQVEIDYTRELAIQLSAPDNLRETE